MRPPAKQPSNWDVSVFRSELGEPSLCEHRMEKGGMGMRHLRTNQKFFFAVLAGLLICSWTVSAQTVGTTATNVAPPTNDNFANAITIPSCCPNIAGTTTEATKEAGGEDTHRAE